MYFIVEIAAISLSVYQNVFFVKLGVFWYAIDDLIQIKILYVSRYVIIIPHFYLSFEQ